MQTPDPQKLDAKLIRRDRQARKTGRFTRPPWQSVVGELSEPVVSADQVRMADLEGKTNGPSRPQYVEGHHSHPTAMPQDSGCLRESRSPPSNHTRTCNKVAHVYM